MERKSNRRQGRLAASALAAGLVLTGSALISPAMAQNVSGTRAVSSGIPQRDTLLKLIQPISVTFDEQRLEDVVRFLREFTGADIIALWQDDRNPDGMDKETLITLDAENLSRLMLIEKVLEQAESDLGGFGGNGWQMTPTGAIQIGPKERLNRYKRVEIYDINDLLMEIPEYPEVPNIDLQSVLQSSGGSGGGQSPFDSDQQDDLDDDRRGREERAEEIIELLTQLVEPDQWVENGGDAASARHWQGHLIINAPDYVHRALNGYPYWPKRLTNASMVNGRRYVSLTTETGLSTIDGFGQVPVTAVVGGQLHRSNDPGGGG